MRRIIFSRLNYNKYTNGSGVGAVSNSNRAALKRRASKSCCSSNNNTSGTRYIKVFFPQPTDGIIQITQLVVYSNGVNIAPNGTASAANSLDPNVINKPINGNLESLETRDFPDIYHSDIPSNFGYWLLDLGEEFTVQQIVYYNRNGYLNRAIGMAINTYDNNFSVPLKTFVLNGDFIQTFNL
jgi:hypothetical protein